MLPNSAAIDERRHDVADAVVMLVALAGRNGRAQRVTTASRGYVSGISLDQLHRQIRTNRGEAARRLIGLLAQWMRAAQHHDYRRRFLRAHRLVARCSLLSQAISVCEGRDLKEVDFWIDRALAR